VVSWARRAVVALRFGGAGAYWGVLCYLGDWGGRGEFGERGDHDEQPCKAGPDKHHVHADNNMQGGYGVQELEDTFAGIDG
jgi:hypothetical protein